jgi:hypothetical protein
MAMAAETVRAWRRVLRMVRLKGEVMSSPGDGGLRPRVVEKGNRGNRSKNQVFTA